MEKKPFVTKEQLDEIVKKYPTPFHLYDEKGIRENAEAVKEAFAWNPGFREYFAVKATPNPFILNILKEYDCGCDCSSLTELMLADSQGFDGQHIMFSSNDTPAEEFAFADELGAIINLDDFTHIDFLEQTIGLISRLTDQKGLDLINAVMDGLVDEFTQLVVIGTGEPQYENMFRHYAWKYPNRVSANICYSDDLAHKLYAAADAFLMPSRFEPCGLTQMISFRYGTVPIVRETGGLKDTVQAYNEYDNSGDGFSFTNYNADEMLQVINYSKHIFYDRKRQWNQMVDRGMANDFSWNASKFRYEGLYNYLLGE